MISHRTKLTWGLWFATATCAWGLVQVQAQQSAATKQDKNQPGAARVKLIEGERVKPDEVMVFTQSTLLEEGDAVKQMSESADNISNVRYNVNAYKIGYAVPAEKVGDKSIFSGPTKGWRATAPGEVSVWPPTVYAASRKETIRQTKLLEPIPFADVVDEMNNLRLYYFPIPMGYEKGDYKAEPTVLAFFIHPQTGTRMTAMLFKERTYSAVGEPLATESQIYVHEAVASRRGEGSSMAPKIFYSKKIEFEAQPLGASEKLHGLMKSLQAARDSGPLPPDDLKAVFQEMASHTGGAVEPVAKATAQASPQRER